MNTFDFYVIEASGPRKADFLKAGVPEARLSRRFVGWKHYGHQSFPRHEWVARLGYVDAPSPAASQQATALAEQWAQKGLRTHVRYHAAE